LSADQDQKPTKKAAPNVLFILRWCLNVHHEGTINILKNKTKQNRKKNFLFSFHFSLFLDRLRRSESQQQQNRFRKFFSETSNHWLEKSNQPQRANLQKKFKRIEQVRKLN
jgi:hypothetical protein